MDFKVAGTEQGITSLQMDIKIEGITEEIMKVALGQAKDGRIHILGEMSKALTAARAELGEYAPRIETFKIATDKIREVIGTGGKVIREIVEKTGRQGQHRGRRHREGRLQRWRGDEGGDQVDQVDRLRSGGRPDLRGHRGQGDGVRRLRELLRHQGRSGPHQPARIGPGAEDLRRRQGRRQVKVKLLGFDDRGKTRLSMKAVDQETGEDLEAKQKTDAPPPREAAGE